MAINARHEPYAKFLIMKSHERDDGPPIESYQDRANAEHALQILNAHEEKNGRGANYYYIKERGT